MDTQDLQRLKARYDIVGSDPALNIAIETAVAVAPTDLAVLIQGESGVGKEAIPQIIHQNSRRRTGKYLAVNCGAIPEGTINAELFGHEKGAFTGAVGERKGYFEEADGGTLFLDEIGELPRETQALLLRVLQNGEFIKVGSSKVQKTDVRVIAATNVNLMHAVMAGKFREDLYYRLNAVQLKIPSLRERKEDIHLLFRKFSSDFAEKNMLRKVVLDHDATVRLCEYRWPGNIRQLKNVAEALTGIESSPLSPGGAPRVDIGIDILNKYIPDELGNPLPVISEGAAPGGGSMSDDEKRMIVKAIFDLKREVDDLRKQVSGATRAVGASRTVGVAGTVGVAPSVPQSGVPGSGISAASEEVDEQMQEEESEAQPVSIKAASTIMMERALEKHGGNVRKAAEELGVSERTLYRKLKELKNR